MSLQIHDPLRIFIGWDDREAVAYHVLSHSLLTRASKPVTISPVRRDHLRGVFTRPRGPLDSTDFSTSRFMVPSLAGYSGLAIFMDCDMLLRTDIYNVLEEVEAQPGCPVYVVQHDYRPRVRTKFLGNVQSTYPCKNWSSFMVFNLQHLDCHTLTPEFVNTASPAELHQFKWLHERSRIGVLGPAWNHLVGEYKPRPDAKIVHFTEGGPWHGPEFANVEYADEWRAELAALTQSVPVTA